uniref:Glutathione peroxidase n=1 Tax=Parascaris equorum TaxID=6256 RepID=A0A914RLY9_PAREQ
MPSSILKTKLALGPEVVDETTRWSQCRLSNQSIYDFQVQTLGGEFTDLAKYRGQVLLIVNVATFCGSFSYISAMDHIPTGAIFEIGKGKLHNSCGVNSSRENKNC